MGYLVAALADGFFDFFKVCCLTNADDVGSGGHDHFGCSFFEVEDVFDENFI